MAVETKDIQSDFLSRLIDERKVVWVFLVNGIKLTGQLIGFDNYVLTLQSPNGMQVIFKHAVSTVCESHLVETGRSRDRAPASHARQGFRG
jgi:host factor-I protein